MRLPAIENPRSLRTRALFGVIRLVSGHRVPDVVRTLHYRRASFGAPMDEVFQAALRGPSEWSIGEREFFAAFVSKMNECEF